MTDMERLASIMREIEKLTAEARKLIRHRAAPAPIAAPSMAAPPSYYQRKAIRNAEIVAALKDGIAISKIAKQYGLSRSTVDVIRLKAINQRAKERLFSDAVARTPAADLTFYDIRSILSVRAYNCLSRSGAQTISEFVGRFTRSGIKLLPNCGPHTLNEIERAFRNFGFAIREDRK